MHADATQIANLKIALFKALDKGEDTETRSSGDMRCPVCGDAYRDHVQTFPETCPTSVGVCTGHRFKL